MKNKDGFTLIELLVVIGLLGILSLLVINLVRSANPKARDIRRQQDLDQIRNALEIYYADYNNYPDSASIVWGDSFKNSDGSKIYMRVLPKDPSSSQGFNYYYDTDSNGSYFKLYSCIENDQSPLYPTTYPLYDCGTGCGNICRYGISSSNASP